MSDSAATGPVTSPQKRRGFARLIASPGFQAWAARFPLTRRIVRREGEAMFDLVAGFCHSQILQALVQLDIPHRLLDGPISVSHLAHATRVPPDRLEVLLNGGVSLGLLKRGRRGMQLTRRGAALAGVPGLADMIRHHDVLYRDLADPVAFFRGEVETELAAFWPYVFGAGAAKDPVAAERYSQLMSDSQSLVAADTLDIASLAGAARILDVGGGTGAFLGAVAKAYPDIALDLFDLPAVVPAARDRMVDLGALERFTSHPGSFRDDPLPLGADVISLVRVLYDHSDETVMALLRSVHAALPKGGRLIVSEPMTGGDKPERAGDAYFALYCMAMRTGRARSAQQIKAMLTDAGFAQINLHRSRRPFVTTVIEAVRLG